MGTVYSHSRLSSFENCPRQFFYRYVEKLPVETESIEAFVGKRVHDVLERLNRFVERGQVPSLGKVLERFRSLWTEHFDGERIRIVRAENPVEAYRELGERCLSNHYRRHYPFDRDETLGIEERVTFALDADGRYRMQGIVDRIVRAADGAIEIHDYKTGRWVPTQQALDQDRQLALYQIGVAQAHPDASVRLVWHYLLRDQTRTSTRTAEQLDALRAATVARIDEIEAEQSFDPRPSALCSWCEFREACPATTASATANVPAAASPEPLPATPPVDTPPVAAAPEPVTAKRAAAPPRPRVRPPPAAAPRMEQLRLL